LTARSEAGAIGVIVEPFNAGVRFVPYERNLGLAGLPAGAVWVGDFEAWRRVAAFKLSKLRMGADSGVLIRALSSASREPLFPICRPALHRGVMSDTVIEESRQPKSRRVGRTNRCATAQRCGMEPFAWFLDVLSRIPAHSITRLSELLPHNWKPAQA
jgi:hypothetical protein